MGIIKLINNALKLIATAGWSSV